jgi:hypothetical protein
MKTWHLVGISLLAVAVVAVAWRMAHARSSRQAGQPLTAHESSAPQAKLLRQSAEVPAIVPQESPSKLFIQGTATPASAPEEKETEQRLGPFSISGSDYTVVLHNKKRQPGSTEESGDTVVAMEIRDAAGAILYQRKFPYQEANGTFSDAWLVDARILAGANGTGLLVSYSFDTEPSAPEAESYGWSQLFGRVGGKFRPFTAPLGYAGELLPAEMTDKEFRTAGPLGSDADDLEFTIWTGHFRLIFPIRVDWAEGKLTPAQPCEEQAAKGDSEVSACQYKVLPENERQVRGTTFVTLCARPGEKCENSEKVVVKNNSKVDLLLAQVKTHWNGGVASGPSGTEKVRDAMDDAGSFALSPNDELWLKVRIDGKEGWMHGEEDFNAFGLPHDQ